VVGEQHRLPRWYPLSGRLIALFDSRGERRDLDTTADGGRIGRGKGDGGGAGGGGQVTYGWYEYEDEGEDEKMNSRDFVSTIVRSLSLPLPPSLSLSPPRLPLSQAPPSP
jgi:hypothetical protein